MAYDAPTPTEFKARFPEFASETDQRVQIFLTEAGTQVDTSWIEADYPTAIMFLAAHKLAMANANAGSGGGSASSGPISSESFQGMSRSYDNSKMTAAQKSSYGGTWYGQEFYLLLQKNKPGVMVAM